MLGVSVDDGLANRLLAGGKTAVAILIGYRGVCVRHGRARRWGQVSMRAGGARRESPLVPATQGGGGAPDEPAEGNGTAENHKKVAAVRRCLHANIAPSLSPCCRRPGMCLYVGFHGWSFGPGWPLSPGTRQRRGKIPPFLCLGKVFCRSHPKNKISLRLNLA